jgi:hypothetical protein
MTYRYSVAVNNARLDAVETTTGTAPKFQIYTGASPASCAAAATGTKLIDYALPSDWMANAAAASKAKSGSWTGAAIAGGVAGYFRMTDSAGTTCHSQGDIPADMTLDNTNIANGQTVTVNTYTINSANT